MKPTDSVVILKNMRTRENQSNLKYLLDKIRAWNINGANKSHKINR